ncbi:MAG: hypothetical protein OCD76_25195 [Reichenbachiella sp.]
MRKYAILTFMSRDMSFGEATDEGNSALLNEGVFRGSYSMSDKSVKDLLRNEDGSIKQFVTQVDALEYCAQLGWDLEEPMFESAYRFDASDPLRSYNFVLSKVVVAV